MADIKRNDPCPCGSGQKYKNCHGSPNPPHVPHPPMPEKGGVENPFKRIFLPDGTVNQKYVMSRLQHLEGLVRENRAFLPLRFDRELLEQRLAERQDMFAGADDQDAFEEAFRGFAEVVLPDLVSKEFDQKAKDVLRAALSDSELTRRDRAAAACGMVLTLPDEGEPAQPHHENPFFDLVLRVTFNESMTRVEFLQGLEDHGEMSDAERDARIAEFLRSVPALHYELQEAFQKTVNRALESYEQGDYSFGIGLDMVLYGVRAIRRMTKEYEDGEGDAYTDGQKQEFAERFGGALKDSFAQDVGEEEELEILNRMAGFLEAAREAGAKKAAKGLSAALEVMEQNPEVRHRMIFAAYHEAVTGSRIYREETEEESARAIFGDPFRQDAYHDYGAALTDAGHLTRAERVYRAAMEFFPEDEEIRRKLAEVATELESGRNAAIQSRIRETERREEEEEETV